MKTQQQQQQQQSAYTGLSPFPSLLSDLFTAAADTITKRDFSMRSHGSPPRLVRRRHRHRSCAQEMAGNSIDHRTATHRRTDGRADGLPLT